MTEIQTSFGCHNGRMRSKPPYLDVTLAGLTPKSIWMSYLQTEIKTSLFGVTLAGLNSNHKSVSIFN